MAKSFQSSSIATHRSPMRNRLFALLALALIISMPRVAEAKEPVTERSCRDAYYHSMFEKKHEVTIRKIHVANDICACLVPKISGNKRLEDAWRNIEYALGGRLELLDLNVRQRDMEKVKELSDECVESVKN